MTVRKIDNTTPNPFSADDFFCCSKWEKKFARPNLFFLLLVEKIVICKPRSIHQPAANVWRHRKRTCDVIGMDFFFSLERERLLLDHFFSHLHPKRHTYFYFCLIDGTTRIFSELLCRNWNRTRISSVAPCLRDLNPGRFTDWTTAAAFSVKLKKTWNLTEATFCHLLMLNYHLCHHNYLPSGLFRP